MKKIALWMAVLVVGLLGLWAPTLLAGNGKPPAPPGQGPCEHGNSGQPCRPDPSPNGKDCEEHGKKGGVNEDHCTGTTETTTTTATTTTEGTTTEVTTSTPTGTTPSTTTTETSDSVTPPVTSTPSSQKPSPGTKPKKKPKGSPTKVVKVTKKPNSVVIVTTADGKKHVAVAGSG